MLGLIYSTTVTVLLLVQCSNAAVIRDTPFGGAGSKCQKAKDPSRTVTGLMVCAGKRVDKIGVFYQGVNEPETLGGPGGECHNYMLRKDEYFNSYDAHAGLRNGKWRIFYVQFDTNKGNQLVGGTKTTKKAYTTPYKYKLAGIEGCYGDEVDKINGVWNPI